MQLVNSCGSIVRIASCGVAVVRHFGGIRFGRDLDGRTGDFIQLILSHRLSFLKDTFVIKIVKGIFDRMPSGHSCTCLFCQEIPFPGDRFPSGAECPFVLAALAKIVPGIFIFLPAGLPITVFIKIVNLIVDLFPFVLRALAVCINILPAAPVFYKPSGLCFFYFRNQCIACLSMNLFPRKAPQHAYA